MCDNGRLAALEKKVEEEARLRAMMDKDLAELNLKVGANTSMLQALATTQGEHTRMLTRLENDVHVLKVDVGELKADVRELKADMREVKTGVRVIVAKIDKALDK
jgi:archaellum component FlaC